MSTGPGVWTGETSWILERLCGASQEFQINQRKFEDKSSFFNSSEVLQPGFDSHHHTGMRRGLSQLDRTRQGRCRNPGCVSDCCVLVLEREHRCWGAVSTQVRSKVTLDRRHMTTVHPSV